MTHPFTPTYIAMAKAAREIQMMAKNPMEPGEWHLIGEGEPTTDYVCSVNDDEQFKDIWGPWLPRLDQLLGMLGGPSDFIANIRASDRHDDSAAAVEFDLIIRDHEDWHELALAVVMWEKHSKRWDGKAWVPA
jgi:hypothetical protein